MRVAPTWAALVFLVVLFLIGAWLDGTVPIHLRP